MSDPRRERPSHPGVAGRGPVSAPGRLTPPGLGERLLDLVAELVRRESVSRHEAELAAYLVGRLAALPGFRLEQVEGQLVLRSEFGCPGRIVLAGHLDTVPPSGPIGPRRTADRISGLGAVDMKGGLAVLVDLVESVARGEIRAALDVSVVLYTCEEVADTENGLGRLLGARPDLFRGDAAVLLEPTDGWVEAGCQGSLRARLSVAGQRAHTARPWQGENAIHRLAPLLGALASWTGREVDLDGCLYRESLQAVGLEGGVAGNVVPDRASVVVNYRFAPDRSGDEALRWLLEWSAPLVGEGGSCEVVDRVDGAAPAIGHPLMAALVALSGRPPRAKLGWTDVARFAQIGLPAVNFGPGDPELAHTPGEWVDAASLVAVWAALGRLIEHPDEEGLLGGQRGDDESEP